MDSGPPRIRKLLEALRAIGRARAGRDRAQRARACCAASAATTSTCSCRRACARIPPTAASTMRTCWSAAKARSRGRSALTLKLAPLPTHRTLGVVQLPDAVSGDGMRAAHRHAEPSAVELVDRTMIDLARGNPAFRPVIDAALIGEPEAILLVEFSRRRRRRSVRRLDDLVALMGDLGLPDSVVRMTDAGAQKALWEVRKAGLNIMMSMRGDGKPVSFIEDCAVPLEHLAEYVDALDARCSRSTARAAPGTRTRRSARCMCGRSSTCGATARRRCARSPKKRR